jgi:hypothetical protein
MAPDDDQGEILVSFSAWSANMVRSTITRFIFFFISCLDVVDREYYDRWVFP